MHCPHCMNSLHLVALPLCLASSLAASTALADPFSAGDHIEATMGFLATSQDHRATGFANPSAPALSQAFRGAPYDRSLGLGLRYETRAVLSHVRMTAGLDLPFASFDGASTMRVDEHDVTPRSMWSWAVRFGLGGEYGFGPVTPFVDLLGSVQRVTTTLNVDGRALDYEALRFGFTGRAGLRVSLRPWFFLTASGELGLLGPTRWSADVGAGFRVGS
jgi:hypothetical protein